MTPEHPQPFHAVYPDSRLAHPRAGFGSYRGYRTGHPSALPGPSAWPVAPAPAGWTPAADLGPAAGPNSRPGIPCPAGTSAAAGVAAAGTSPAAAANLVSPPAAAAAQLPPVSGARPPNGAPTHRRVPGSGDPGRPAAGAQGSPAAGPWNSRRGGEVRDVQPAPGVPVLAGAESRYDSGPLTLPTSQGRSRAPYSGWAPATANHDFRRGVSPGYTAACGSPRGTGPGRLGDDGERSREGATRTKSTAGRVRTAVLAAVGLLALAAMPTAAVARPFWGPVASLALPGLALVGAGCLLAAVPKRREVPHA